MHACRVRLTPKGALLFVCRKVYQHQFSKEDIAQDVQNYYKEKPNVAFLDYYEEKRALHRVLLNPPIISRVSKNPHKQTAMLTFYGQHGGFLS